MTDETTGAEASATEATAEALVETPEATTGQTATENAVKQTDPAPGDDAAAPPKKKHWAHERIDELTRQRREAERQAEFWKAKAEKIQDLDSLEYDDQIAERVLIRNRREQGETAAESAGSLAQEIFDIRQDEARERFPDYDAVALNPKVRITPGMAQVIQDSELGPDIAYQLGKNPAEAVRIAALPAHRQAAELGKLEARISAPKRLAKQPPDPVQPVNGIKAGGAKTPEEMSFTEYRAWREANP